MKVTLNWLKELVDFDLTVEELTEKLTLLGLEVEDVYKTERQFSNIIIGKVTQLEKHPDSDHLSLCQVDVGKDRHLEIVCGAPNVRQGGLYPTAVVGAKLVSDFEITAREIRGYQSEGMLCSEAELGLTERSEGLMELENGATVGHDFHAYLGEPDTVIDIFITPNRPDCMSVIGIAREIAALTGSTLSKPNVTVKARETDVSEIININISDTDRCYRYSARYMENVTIKPSPFWLAQRLQSIGVRSINNVVDITNYVMMETGQPLHAFDYTLLAGKEINVRTAEPGEAFTTLDGQDHTLAETDLLICDAEKPVALAGVMGGLNSEVVSKTTRVLLESAYFESTGIRKTSSSLELSTESSKRFERGIDPNGTVYAMNRAAQLMVQLASAEIVGDAVDHYPTPVTSHKLSLSVNRTNRLLGTSLSAQHVSDILTGLEIQVATADDDILSTTIPTFRVDLERPIDLIEEVARCYGYDEIPMVMAPPVNQLQQANPVDQYKDKIRQVLSGMGMREALSLNLISEKAAKPFLQNEQGFVELLNPLSTDLAGFRPNIISTLLTTVAYNRNRQMHNLRLFEMGNAAFKDASGSFSESTQLGGILAGERIEQSWNDQPQPYTFYDAKGFVESFLQMIGISDVSIGESADSFWSSERASILINGAVAGSFGKLGEDTVAAFKIKTNDIYAFWFDFEVLFNHRRITKTYDPVSRFPSSPFDLALVVDANISIAVLKDAIRKAAGPFLKNVQLFDYYQGEQVEQDKKSVAFSLTFSSKERTLSDEEVEQAVNNILTALGKQFDAELRS